MIVGSNRAVQFILLVVFSLLALALCSLGLETAPVNLLGWFLLLVGLGYLIGGAVYLFWYKRPKPAVREEISDRSFWLILPGFLAVFFGPPLELIYCPAIFPRGLLMQVIGLSLVIVAVILRLWTRQALKGMYTGHIQVMVDHRLVQAGPYRWVRHPGYSGFVLMALGISIGYSSAVGLVAILALMLPSLAYRMQVEEKLLIEEFGDQYRAYVRRTKRLVPGVW